MKALDITTLIASNLALPSSSNTILSCFFLFFLIIDLTNFYYYCRTRNTYRKTTNEANAAIEMQPLVAETKIRKCSK